MTNAEQRRRKTPLVIGKPWWLGAVAVVIAASGFFAFRASVAAADLRAGQTLYLANCASCHGVDLEGQPNWQTPLADGRLPAPPHDETGHTWHHSDAQLFAIVKLGMGAVVEGYGPSGMPAFSGLISDRDIETILRFIKSTWPLREQEYQGPEPASVRRHSLDLPTMGRTTLGGYL